MTTKTLNVNTQMCVGSIPVQIGEDTQNADTLLGFVINRENVQQHKANNDASK